MHDYTLPPRGEPSGFHLRVARGALAAEFTADSYFAFRDALRDTQAILAHRVARSRGRHHPGLGDGDGELQVLCGALWVSAGWPRGTWRWLQQGLDEDAVRRAWRDVQDTLRHARVEPGALRLRAAS
ncbi:MAG: hypothetical protein H6739_25600 [Alphaproteobacteria bacterium]|nr:hypothetical protein [Alphaproteobacteria bacterium]